MSDPIQIRLIEYTRSPGPVSNAEYFQYVFEIDNIQLATIFQLSATIGKFEFHQNPKYLTGGILKTHCPQSIKAAGKQGLFATAMGMMASVLKDLQSHGVSFRDCLMMFPPAVQIKIIARFDLMAIADLCRGEKPKEEYWNIAHILAGHVEQVHPVWALEWAQIKLY